MLPLFTRRHFLTGALATSATLVLYGDEIARHELSITTPTFFIRNLPPAFHGYRIAQISDLHLEEFTEDFYLRRVIQHVNSLQADLVLITGDFVSRGPLSVAVSYAAAARCAALLRALTCPLRFGVLGNHDVVVGARIVRNHMETNGLPLLVNQHVPIERGRDRIFIAGIDDLCGGLPNLDLAIPANPGAPVILMAHEPDFADRVATHPRGPLVDLILSGHSHGGQIRFPGIRPLALPQYARLYPEGHYLVGNSQLYTNRGIGTVGLPLRLNCPPEITLMTLQPAISSETKFAKSML